MKIYNSIFNITIHEDKAYMDYCIDFTSHFYC